MGGHSLLLIFVYLVAQDFFLCVKSIPDTPANCSSPAIRVEWNTFTDEEKAAYFDAEWCLLKAPAQTSIPGVTSRYEDLVGVHSEQSDIYADNDTWHMTGQFLAVHRYYLHTHETLLREECGYSGLIPYWNEVLDAGSFANASTVLDFGGEGAAQSGYAVLGGPFTNLTSHLGPGAKNTNHVLTRRLDPASSKYAGQSYVNAVNGETAFAHFQKNLFNTLHDAGHAGVGGDMLNIMTSPNDPIFWLHHAYLDYVWWKWQGDDQSRIHDLTDAGYETQGEPSSGYVATNEGTVLSVYGILPSITVGDVLYTKGGYLCYIYV
ncbi:Di-copper centre-containing protein [Desarmillaria ectypa]|nr:Di-copper centre-containing protein [Desarmillaria ectypa]